MNVVEDNQKITLSFVEKFSSLFDEKYPDIKQLPLDHRELQEGSLGKTILWASQDPNTGDITIEQSTLASDVFEVPKFYVEGKLKALDSDKLDPNWEDSLAESLLFQFENALENLEASFGESLPEGGGISHLNIVKWGGARFKQWVEEDKFEWHCVVRQDFGAWVVVDE